MPYDPKRPRPVVDRDEPAPVDALIESVEAPPEGLPVVAAPDPVDAAPDPVVVAADPVVVAAEPEEAPDAAVPAEPVTARTPTTSSDVPIAPAPVAPTANRAVMFVMFGAGIVTLLVLILLRRRHR